MRCPDCNKFVGLEMGDPEVSDLGVNEDGVVTASVRIVRNCADCGTELKEATFDVSDEMPEDEIKKHTNVDGETKHSLEVEEDTVDIIEEGGGRYKKSYYGASVDFTVTCSCDADKPKDEKWSWSGSMADKIAASHMDELT